MKANKPFLINTFVFLVTAGELCAGCYKPVGQVGITNGFEQRAVLQKQAFELNRADKKQERIAEINKKLQAIDRQYNHWFNKIDQMLAKTDSRAACCSSFGDPILDLYWSISAYGKNKLACQGAFVANLPEKESQVQYLFVLDDICMDGGKERFFQDYPSMKALEELFNLVFAGNNDALSKYVLIATHCQGAYAEIAEIQLASLVTNKPDIVVGNWRMIKKVLDDFGLCSDRYTKNAQETIEKYRNYESKNVGKKKVANEIVNFLEGQKEDCEKMKRKSADSKGVFKVKKPDGTGK